MSPKAVIALHGALHEYTRSEKNNICSNGYTPLPRGTATPPPSDEAAILLHCPLTPQGLIAARRSDHATALLRRPDSETFSTLPESEYVVNVFLKRPDMIE